MSSQVCLQEGGRREGDTVMKGESGVTCFENRGRTACPGMWKLDQGKEMDSSL